MSLRRHCRAMALIAVLWLVAALSLIVTGLLQSVRMEARSIGQERVLVAAAALGESAIQRALQALVAAGKPVDRLLSEQITQASTVISVQAMPLNGYIDLNHAPVELLAQMFQTAAGLAPEAARTLAQAIVEQRAAPMAGGSPDLFESPEDLLRLPGLDYPVYARVAPLLTTDIQGSGRVNPLAAPLPVLRVLAQGNDAAVAHYATARAQTQESADTSAMNTAWLETVDVPALELTALVPLPDSQVARIVRRFFIGTRRDDGLPWRAFFTASFLDIPLASGQ